MALIARIFKNFQCIKNINIVANGFRTSCARDLDQQWRKDRRLAMNPNVFGPLTNLPDYSYADGRVAPIGVRKMGRIEKNRKYLEKIRRYIKEVDFAVERHTILQREKENQVKRILDSKLKPKGQLVLSDK